MARRDGRVMLPCQHRNRRWPMTSDDRPAGENRYFDQRYCGKVMRIGAIACAAVLLGDVVFLATGHPPTRCPGWLAPGQHDSAWGVVGGVSLLAALVGLCAMSWDWLAQRYVDQLELDRRLAECETQAGDRARAWLHYALMIDFGGLLVVMMMASVLVCLSPVLYASGFCFLAE